MDSQARSAAMMRVNHCGEVCAQALYKAQAEFAHNQQVRTFLQNSAIEESAHLEWTKRRLKELNGKVSATNPGWFAASYGVGVLAALAGDRASLGFLAETERQVVRHLSSQLVRLPLDDHSSRAVIRAMRNDEREHAERAECLGGSELPLLLRIAMAGAAKVMTNVAYRF